MSRLLALALALSLAPVSLALADTLPVPPSQFDPAELLPPPPRDGSLAAKAEMDELHRIARSRTAKQFAAADRDDHMENPMAFAGVMGRRFDLANLPQTKKLLKTVVAEEKAAAKSAKNYFKRNRPWIVDPSLKACATDDAPRSSYPSGHSTMGYAVAVTLSKLSPEKAPAIMARASEFAENRLVCSMHYRRDIEAGQTLGTLVAYTLLQTPDVKAQFAKAEQELRAAGITHGL